MRLKIDDPRLTAFALGEPLPEGDRRDIWLLLEDSAEAREMVAEVRSLALDLRSAYAADRHVGPASRELAKIIDFNAPHAVHTKTPWTTHVGRIAAMIAFSAAVVAVGMVTWAGSSRPAFVNRPISPTEIQNADDDLTPPDQVMLAIPHGAGVESTSYVQIRRSLNAGQLPRRDAVRITELVNQFSYRDESDASASQTPVALYLEVAAAPWQPEHRLVRVFLKARPRGGDTNGVVARNLAVAVKFNPWMVAAYRTITRDSSSPDQSATNGVGAREVGPGFAATALYEIIPTGSPVPSGANPADGWRRLEGMAGNEAKTTDLLTVTMDLQTADGDALATENRVWADDGRPFDAATADFRFAAAVAAFGMLLSDTPGQGTISPGLIAAWAQPGQSGDQRAPRAEFVEVVRQAGSLLAARNGPS